MSRTIEYLIVLALGLALVAFVVSPLIHATANSLSASAEMIRHATHQ
jgi:hypothetical protein